MAINAKMLQYRGTYANFRPSLLLPGQFAVVLSGDPNTTTGRAVYMCFSAGTATRILADGDVVSDDDTSEDLPSQEVDLSNYYTKEESYSKEEIDAIMGSYINDIDALVGGDA